MQMPGLAAAAMTRAALRAAESAWRLAELHRVRQRVEAACKQFINRFNDFAQFRAVEMALHQADHVLHQQIPLDLHDGRRCGADKVHDEVVARFLVAVVVIIALFLVEVGIVKSHFKRRADLGQIVQAHAHFIERLAKIFIARHRPAHLQQMLGRIEPDAGLFFVNAGSARSQ